MANITVDIKKKSIDIGSNLVAIGKGGMNPGVYDPQEIKADAFDMDNMVDGVDKHYLTTEQIEEFENKQDALTAGDNIDITNNVISATDTTYTAGDGISIDENNVITNTRVSAEWGCIQGNIGDQTDLQGALDDKQDVLTAGDNVQIENNVISATDTTYTAGEGISIDANNVISNTQTSAEWGNIEGDIEDQTDLQAALDDKQDIISDLSEIRSNATAGKDASDTIATYGDIVTHDADEFATADSVGEGVLTIQKNSTTVDTFSANATENKTINITVPTQASDIGALPDTTKYAANLDLSINSSTYVITAQLKDQDGNNLGTQRTIDLPLESVVVDGEYDAENKKIILTLENGNTIEFSVADLVSGLQTEITVDNKLDADLVDDTTASHKFVTSTEKSCISTAVQPGDLVDYAKCCDIPTDNCQLNNGCGYTTCTGTLVESDLQPYAKSCDLATVATSGKYCDLDGRVTDNCQIANSCGFTTCTGTLVQSDIENLAQCCDIPTDNCQLANSCGYTTCTGTLVQSDIQNLAQCCDIPTDNCQLANSCGYTTCTGDMQYSDFEYVTLTGNNITLSLSSKITPSANFTVNAPATIKDGQIYVLRVETGASSYTMTLGTNITNPSSVDLTLTANTVSQFVFVGVGGKLELQRDTPDLSGYQTKSCMVCDLTGADHTHYPTAKAVADAMACAGVGDMLKSVYDPCGCEGDAFNACNMYNMPHIPTDNCELSNSCGFTTCTGTLVASDIQNLAQCCDIPTDNCQLANSCGYTTCTGTLVPSDLNNYAKCCDIPTNNCQLTNGCGYIKGINCSDVTTALGYTPYNSTNPAGYTTCTGTLVQSDIQNLAQCCDIPTDNCQLANGCDYATCCYVNDSINSVTAYYITKDAQGNQFATYAELSSATTFYSGGEVRVPTRNDYTIVLSDENYDNATTRYSYNNGWQYQYTVNETPLTQAQLDALNSGITCSKVNYYDNCLAQCCDIPTDNCQLDNGCGYIKGINCNDVTTALGYTPYNSTNPNGYTSCTGTLVQSDLDCYAKCCDIPTNNCQLTNGCGYTKCTGDMEYADFNFVTKTGSTITLDLASSIEPSANFTVNAPSTIIDGQTYILRVTNGATVYTMTLGTNITNPHSTSVVLTANAVDQFVFLAVGGKLELQPSDVDTTYAAGTGLCLTGNTFSNTGVLSVNGCSGTVCLDIPTDNCQLANGCGYTTCTGTLSTCSDITTALGFTPYSAANPSGYTSCTGTLVQSDIQNLAQCCDIPTNNNQLTNGCGYTTCTGTVSTCSDIISKLGYTPYNSTNPNGYTTCTGTLVPSDIANLAQCCDIPTNNNQLTNGCGYITGISCLDVTTALGYTPYSSGNPCNYINNFAGVISALGYTPYNTTNPNGYTTCTGTLNGGDLKTINGCCLVGSGDICIQSGGIQNLPGSPVTICYKWTGDSCAFEALGTYRCDTEYNVFD